LIVNTFAVLDGFLALLRLVLSLLILGLGISAVRYWLHRRLLAEDRVRLEDRGYLLFLLAGLLLVLNVAAWPLFYLLLQSYVPQWPDVMCIYGVTRIGAGSLGPSRFLPTLVSALEIAKPALIFLSGAWLVLYLVNRTTRTAPLTGRVLVLVLIAAGVAGGDAIVELAYLFIPKKEQFLSAGCCTEALDTSRSTRFLPAIWVGPEHVSWLYAAYYGLNLLLVLAVRAVSLRLAAPRRLVLSLLLGLALLSLAINGIFLVEVAAPRLLHLPYHHCPYDLVPRAPESLVGVALFFVGCFAVGWAAMVGWLGRTPEATPMQAELIGRLLYLAFVGYLSSLGLMTGELLLA
jgi:hypothetical protein